MLDKQPNTKPKITEKQTKINIYINKQTGIYIYIAVCMFFNNFRYIYKAFTVWTAACPMPRWRRGVTSSSSRLVIQTADRDCQTWRQQWRMIKRRRKCTDATYVRRREEGCDAKEGHNCECVPSTEISLHIFMLLRNKYSLHPWVVGFTNVTKLFS